MRIGSAMTGPTPGTMSRSSPIALSGTTMSLKKIAASTPNRRTGCRVISVTRSGRKQESSIAMPSRRARYSGRARPAWRMNQTGVCGTGSRRQALRKAESWVLTAGTLVLRAGRDRGRDATRRRQGCDGCDRWDLPRSVGPPWHLSWTSTEGLRA